MGLGLAIALTTAPMSSAASPPTPIAVADWITSDDYPMSALRANAQGVTTVRVDVGPDGQTMGCAVTRSSGSEVLDDISCLLMRDRAKFLPARNPLGKAVAGSFYRGIRWQIPGRTPNERPAMPLKPIELTVQFDVAADGTTSNCRSVSQGQPMTPIDPCAMLAEMRFEPIADPAGQPKSRRVTVQTTLRIDDR